jgi:hypothetical protein
MCSAPPGYKQTIPAKDLIPPPIVPGKQYFFECSTVNARAFVVLPVACKSTYLACKPRTQRSRRLSGV